MSKSIQNGSERLPTSTRYEAPAQLAFKDISYTLTLKKIGQKVILDKVSGYFSTGVNGIMGPSGGGKTSLLDLLSERMNLKGVEGEVLLNGEPTPANFQLISGYVVQDDVIMGTLTVRENLLFSANLRLSSKMTKEEKTARVDEIIQKLGLTSCANTRVGTALKRGVSGGERKRCNVGTELIIRPQVLFLDEPTTGLDASTSFALTSLLDELARKDNMTIIMSIHQPRASIFQQLDRITLLSKGKTVFHGKKDDILPYFDGIGFRCQKFDNPADFLLDVTLNNEPAIGGIGPVFDEDDDTIQLVDLPTNFINSEQNKSEAAVVENASNNLSRQESLSEKTRVKATYQTSFFTQTWYVMERSWKNIARNPLALVSNTMSAIIFAFMMGLIFLHVGNDFNATTGFGNRYGFFLFLTNTTIFGSMPVLELFRQERALFVHEKSNGYYRTSAYFAAKMLIDICIIRSSAIFIYILVSYWLVGLQNDAQHFFTFVCIIWTAMFTAVAMLLCFTQSIENQQLAQVAVTVPALISSLFAGLLLNVSTLPIYLKWLPYLSLARYALQMFSINEMGDLTFYETPSGNHSHPFPVSGEVLLKQQGIPDDRHHIWMNEIVLVCAGFFMYFLTYLQLARLKKLK